MTTKKIPTPKRTYLSGHDQLCAMLLSTIDGCDEYDAAAMTKYRDRAQQILRSPHAFNNGDDTLSVTDIVLNDHLRTIGEADLRSEHAILAAGAKEFRKMVTAVLDEDHEAVTATAQELRNMLYLAISASTLYGAAIMFELLQDGAK
jgi:hypothetical protein